MNKFEVFPYRTDLMPATLEGIASLQCGFASGSMLNYLSCEVGVDVNDFYKVVADYNIQSDMLVNAAGLMVSYSGEQTLWQTDAGGAFRDVRVLLYDENTGLVERRNEREEDLLRKGIEYSVDCFFGGDVPPKHPDRMVGVVQHEMAAVLASIAIPSISWLAVGYAKNLTAAALKTIRARRVILYPDSMAVEWWRAVAREVPGVSVSTFFAESDRLENEVLVNIINERSKNAS